MTLHINERDDWGTLAQHGLDVVVDPMVVRAGELFLEGPAGSDDAELAWSFLKRNVHALGMFFDAVILEDRIPVFNYGDTFDMGLNFDDRVLATVNQKEPVLFDVAVTWGPYGEVKAAALGELRKLYSGPARIKKQTAVDVLSELAASDYRWQPSLGPLDEELKDDDEKKLARYFLGGLIFSAYAQLLGGTHLIQPKRSRLLLAVALSHDGASYQLEEKLFAELKKRAGASVTELPWRPSLFPYLLSVASNPRSVLSEALSLRASSEVKEYRDWLQRAFQYWDRDGTLAPLERDVKAIATAVDRKLGVIPTAPQVEMKVTVADVAAAAAGTPTLPGSVDPTPTLAALWGWVFSSLPGKRYRKLLTRAIVADHQYAQIQNRLATVWRASP